MLSCSKNPTPLVAAVTFTANGISYNWKEERNTSASNYVSMQFFKQTSGLYYLSTTTTASNNLIAAKDISLFFQASGIAVNTPFNYTTTASSAYISSVVVTTALSYDPTTVYLASSVGDFATITFTSIHDQKADGNFTARLTRVSDLAKIDITNGTFVNVDLP